MPPKKKTRARASAPPSPPPPPGTELAMWFQNEATPDDLRTFSKRLHEWITGEAEEAFVRKLFVLMTMAGGEAEVETLQNIKDATEAGQTWSEWAYDNRLKLGAGALAAGAAVAHYGLGEGDIKKDAENALGYAKNQTYNRCSDKGEVACKAATLCKWDEYERSCQWGLAWSSTEAKEGSPTSRKVTQITSMEIKIPEKEKKRLNAILRGKRVPKLDQRSNELVPIQEITVEFEPALTSKQSTFVLKHCKLVRIQADSPLQPTKQKNFTSLLEPITAALNRISSPTSIKISSNTANKDILIQSKEQGLSLKVYFLDQQQAPIHIPKFTAP